MSFKDVIASDVHDTFMNADEFSDMHEINGKMMPVQVDSNEQIEREKRSNQHMDGIYKNQKLIYVAATDYGPMPKQGSLIQFDKRPYKVADAISEDIVPDHTVSIQSHWRRTEHDRIPGRRTDAGGSAGEARRNEPESTNGNIAGPE